MIRSIISFLFLSLVISGCSKEAAAGCPEGFVGPLSPEEEVLPATWHLSAVYGSVAADLTKDHTDNPSTDLFSQFGDCVKNARYVFEANRAARYIASEVTGNACQEKLLFDGTWQLENDLLSLNAGCFHMEAPVTWSANKKRFWFSVSEEVYDHRGKKVVMEVTYEFTLAEPGS